MRKLLQDSKKDCGELQIAEGVERGGRARVGVGAALPSYLALCVFHLYPL